MNKLGRPNTPNATYQVPRSSAFWFWRRRFLKGFYHIWAWRPSWSCDQDHLNKLSFPRPKESPYEIWVQLAQWFQRRRCLKMLTDGRTDGRRSDWCTISSPMSLRLRWAKKHEYLSLCFWGKNEKIWQRKNIPFYSISCCIWIGNHIPFKVITIFTLNTVNVLKFQPLVTCQYSLDKQGRPRSDWFWRSLIRVFPVCYSDKYFVNSSPENQHFMLDQKEKSVWNFRTFELRHGISNNVVCATSKASDQPAQTRSQIRTFASRCNILWVFSYWLDIIWSF